MEKRTAKAAEPQREEVVRLLSLLEEEIHRARISKRGLERQLGLSQGYLASLLKGKITLKVRHVFVLGRALGVEPLLLFFRAAPPEEQERFARALGLAEGGPAQAPQVLPVTREELAQMVRELVREELGRKGR